MVFSMNAGSFKPSPVSACGPCQSRHVFSSLSVKPKRLPFRNASKPVRQVRLRANNDNEEEIKELREKYFSRSNQSSPEPADSDASVGDALNSVNPLALGRQARRAFDDLWDNISRVATPTRSYAFDDILGPGLSDGSDAPQTTVLVVGATGRVGRILVRKLLLRQYKVKALVRPAEGMPNSRGLSAAVEVVSGDVGEIKDCQAAVAGVDKVCGVASTHFFPLP